MSECIHGLDEALCDSCTPAPTPVTPPRTARVRPASSGPAGRKVSSRPVTSKRVAGGGPAKAVDLPAHRVFHVTHVDNLEAILASGRLLGDAAGAEPRVDISAADHRAARREVAVPVPDAEITVAHCVPFWATPESQLWHDIRAKHADPRLSGAARSASAPDFVFLATTVGRLEAAAPLVLALDDAADSVSPMTADTASIHRELRRLIAVDQSEPDVNPLARVELLAAGEVPLEAITLIGVANSKVRDRVRPLVADADLTARVAMHPPWFMRP